MKIQMLTRLAAIDVVAIILTTMLSYAQVITSLCTSQMEFFKFGIMVYPIIGALANFYGFIFPVFALLFAFVIKKAAPQAMTAHTIVINAFVFCAAALFINVLLSIIIRIPGYWFDVYLWLPPNILCITMTQIAFALLFLRKKQLHSEETAA